MPDKLKDVITLDRGATLKLNVDLTGTFPFQAEWLLNGVLLDSSRKEVKYQTSETEAGLTVSGMTKLEEGVYTLNLKNEFGECKTDFTVRIRDTPSAPERLKVVEVHSESMIIAWDAPSNDGGAPVKKYLIEKKDASRNKWVSVGTTEKLTMEVKKLFEGNSYFFRVTAQNEVGNGSSVETTEPVTAKSLINAPQPPGRPEASNVTKSSCTLTWTAPTNDGGQPVIGYIVERKERLSSLWAVITKDPVKSTTLSVEDLNESFEYEFRIIAINKTGKSEPSSISSTVLAKDPYDPPAAPGCPRADNLTKDSVTLNWSSPANDGGSPTLYYRLEYKMIDAFKWTTLEQNLEVTTYSIGGLMEGQSYVFRVFAVNAAGPSKPSNTSDPITIKEPVGRTLKLIEPLGNVTMKTGKDAYFECKILAEPTPSVKWTKNGRELSGSRYDIIINKRMVALSIKNCEEDDQGRYECTITNEFGTVKSNALLTIEGTISAYCSSTLYAYCSSTL